ncbi:DUF1471 domain-containing protein [Chimaeribacter arupi]|uniref:DUF1471 domain-containing protein n=2 Tax=Yersiniaceae TaxID=1903411 RepID=A0A2N5EM84_9GAMM|nr:MULTISPECIES: DUF1471 domain-containing protein [Yersiniaceae]MBS0969617.1 DUF1471 domain-containing protein [Nissabacter archeti]PLR35301.1 DUF1471 domain-containing protein [Chimaeribacter arupi]PLR44097.1 DUF1471 domain-containing protein [Chimaeribacter arupi]PLR48508.1 DUF1471 domain-containing protein [Chimaeribacter arupi]PLR48903.1 DUF1471 domain-containing protein [Chimaeribacter arupi]
MKNLKIALAALALTTASFGAFAAQEVTQAPADAQQIGTVSARSTDLSGLERQIAQKAQEQGASAYRITSASGSTNLVYGTAELYK